MPDLNDQQFAQYSAIKVPHKTLEYEYKPLPASMERHAPGEYQPTLPGMEKMLKGEQTSTEVFFKNKSAYDPETGDVGGSDWYSKTTLYHPKVGTVAHDNLHPTQDWVDDNYIHGEDKPPLGGRTGGNLPLVEKADGKNVIQDGHHRVVRDILSGLKRTRVARWV